MTTQRRDIVFDAGAIPSRPRDLPRRETSGIYRAARMLQATGPIWLPPFDSHDRALQSFLGAELDKLYAATENVSTPTPTLGPRGLRFRAVWEEAGNTSLIFQDGGNGFAQFTIDEAIEELAAVKRLRAHGLSEAQLGELLTERKSFIQLADALDSGVILEYALA